MSNEPPTVLFAIIAIAVVNIAHAVMNMLKVDVATLMNSVPGAFILLVLQIYCSLATAGGEATSAEGGEVRLTYARPVFEERATEACELVAGSTGS